MQSPTYKEDRSIFSVSMKNRLQWGETTSRKNSSETATVSQVRDGDSCTEAVVVGIEKKYWRTAPS